MTSLNTNQRRASDGQDISAKAATQTKFGLVQQALNQPMADYYMILGSTILLTAFGALMVLSSSSVYGQAVFYGPYYFVIRQLVFIAAGVPVVILLSRWDEKFLKKISWLVMIVVLFLLVVTLIYGSTQGKGNRAWIDFGLFTLQPSEFAKFAVVLWAAAVWSNQRRKLHEVRTLLFPVVIGFGLVLVLVALQNDLGTALVIAAIMFALLFFVGASWQVLLMLLMGAATGVVMMVVQSPNRMLRIFSFLGSEAGAGASDQPQSAIYALASGGWFGLGIGASRQKWGALYDGAHNDFILAVIGEELGLVGVLIVVGALAVFGFAGFRIAAKSTTLFHRVIATGITSWIMIQALVNILVVMKMLPVIGVPLPFVSYGGSAMLACLAGVGLLLNCARNEPAAQRVFSSKKKTKKIDGKHSVSAVVDATR